MQTQIVVLYVDSVTVPKWLCPKIPIESTLSGRSSGVERNLAKVEVEGSNPFARSKLFNCLIDYMQLRLFYFSQS